MVIKKKAGTYDVYTLEVSYGELQAFRVGLEADHANPVGDEKLAELAWYLDKLPGPGEEEEKTSKAEGGGAPGEEEGDLPIPMPPGSQAGTPPEGSEEEPSFPPEEGGISGGEPGGEPGGMPGGEPAGGQGGPEVGLPEPEESEEQEPAGLKRMMGGAAQGQGPRPARPPRPEETDRRLPKPPRE